MAGQRKTSLLNHPLLRRLKSLPGLLLGTAFSVVLVYGINRPPFIDNDLYNFAYNHRSTAQAVLSLLASIFSFWQLYVLSSMVYFEAEIQLLGPVPPTLSRLKWWRALAGRKFDSSLPAKFYPPMLAVWGLALLPNLLWTGALTPNLATGHTNVSIVLPFYPPDPEGQSWNATWTPVASHNVVRTPWGSFSYSPAYDRGDSMINTASGVIADKDKIGTRPRSDKTGYTYTTRSYGVGSSVGLFANFNGADNQSVSLQPTYLQFQEIGYNASVDCGFNASSEWGILDSQTGGNQSSSQLIPNVYLVGGTTPDQSLYWQLQYSALNDSNVVSIEAHPELGSTGNGTVVIAAGRGNYNSLNKTQCNVTFIPTLFNVDVDLGSNEITVTGAGNASEMDPTAQINATFEAWNCQTLPTLDEITSTSNNVSGCSTYTAKGQPGLGNIATRALRQLNDLSTLGTSLHTSDLGEMFLSLIENEVQYSENSTINILDFIKNDLGSPSQTQDASTLEYSVVQGLKSLIDDSLLAFASAQLVLHHDTATKNTNGTLTVGAVQVGTSPYIYALFAFNVLLLVIYIEEVIRTHFWAALPTRDYEDLDSVIHTRTTGRAKLANRAVANTKEESLIGDFNPENETENVQKGLESTLEDGGETISLN